MTDSCGLDSTSNNMPRYNLSKIDIIIEKIMLLINLQSWNSYSRYSEWHLIVAFKWAAKVKLVKIYEEFTNTRVAFIIIVDCITVNFSTATESVKKLKDKLLLMPFDKVTTHCTSCSLSWLHRNSASFLQNTLTVTCVGFVIWHFWRCQTWSEDS